MPGPYGRSKTSIPRPHRALTGLPVQGCWGPRARVQAQHGSEGTLRTWGRVAGSPPPAPGCTAQTWPRLPAPGSGGISTLCLLP